MKKSLHRMMAEFHTCARRFVFVVMATAILTMSAKAQESEIHSAVEAKDVAKIRQLLKDNPALINAKSSGGTTPLHLAAGMDEPELVKLLLANKADIRAKTKKGYTPLHVAAYVNAAKAARLLVQAGAKIDIAANDGATPLRLAIKRNSDAVIKVLAGETKAAYEEKSIDARFTEGAAAEKSGQLEKAYNIFSKLLREQPGSEKINFAYGMICMSLKEYARASLAFERIVEQINPKNDRARLELARTYVATEQIEAAKREFQTVLSHNPEPAVRANIENNLAAIRRLEKKWTFGGRVDVGFTDDSNVNVGPDSKIISIEPIAFGGQFLNTLTIDQNSQPVAAQSKFASAALSGVYDAGEQGNWMTTMDGGWYRNWLSGGASVASNESSFYQAIVGMRYAEPKEMFRLSLRFGHIEKAGEALMALYGVAPSYQFVFGEGANNVLSTDGIMEFRDWDKLTDRNSFYVLLGERVQHLMGARRSSVGAGAAAFHDHAKAEQYQNSGVILTADGSWRLPLDFSLYARAKYMHSEYAEKEALAPEKRKDDQTDLSAGINWLITRQWGIDANYDRINNDSTFGLYQYDRDVVTISTFCAF